MGKVCRETRSVKATWNITLKIGIHWGSGDFKAMAGPILLFSQDMKLVEECEGKLNADGQILFLLQWNYRCPSSSTVAAQNNCLSIAPVSGNVSLLGFTSLSFPLPVGISVCGAKPTQLYCTKFQRHNPAEVKGFIPRPWSLICWSCSFLHGVFVLRDKNWKAGDNSQPFLKAKGSLFKLPLTSAS